MNLRNIQTFNHVVMFSKVLESHLFNFFKIYILFILEVQIYKVFFPEYNCRWPSRTSTLIVSKPLGRSSETQKHESSQKNVQKCPHRDRQHHVHENDATAQLLPDTVHRIEDQEVAANQRHSVHQLDCISKKHLRS